MKHNTLKLGAFSHHEMCNDASASVGAFLVYFQILRWRPKWLDHWIHKPMLYQLS